MPLALMPAFLALGVALGALGVLFNKTLILALDWRARAFARVPMLYAVLVGAAIGVLAFVLPLAIGGGETLIPRIAAAGLPLQVLLLIAVVRFLGTMASYPVNVPAGIFAPLLAIGTTVGLIAGQLVEMMLVELPASAGLPVPPLMGNAFAVTAMAGLFSATIRAPLVGVVLLVELTGAFQLILPIMVTAVTAHVVAEALGGRPIYEVLLERTLRLAGQAAPPKAAGTSSPVGIDDSSPSPHGKR
jgi:CIC family chloride channel protein